MKAKTEKIGPKKATQILERNTKNRPVSQKLVDFYAQQMKAGEWVLNGESIVIAQDDTLLDGQHRLWAVIESGRAIETLVVRLDKEDPTYAMETIDTGKARTARDVLSMRHVKNAHNVASVIRVLLHMEQGQFARRSLRHTNRDVVDALDAYPGIEDFVAQRVSKFPLGWKLHGHFLALWYATHDRDGDGFFAPLLSGVGLMPGSPQLALRKKFERIAATPAGNKPKALAQASYIIRAWNAYAVGATLEKIAYTPANPDPPLVNVPMYGRKAQPID